MERPAIPAEEREEEECCDAPGQRSLNQTGEERSNREREGVRQKVEEREREEGVPPNIKREEEDRGKRKK